MCNIKNYFRIIISKAEQAELEEKNSNEDTVENSTPETSRFRDTLTLISLWTSSSFIPITYEIILNLGKKNKYKFFQRGNIYIYKIYM